MCDTIWASPTIGATNVRSVDKGPMLMTNFSYRSALDKVEELKAAFAAKGLDIQKFCLAPENKYATIVRRIYLEVPSVLDLYHVLAFLAHNRGASWTPPLANFVTLVSFSAGSPRCM